jgi:hypothetical protein
MPYLPSKGSKKQTSNSFTCVMKNSRALYAQRCVAGNWIPAALNLHRTRSRRFVSGETPALAGRGLITRLRHAQSRYAFRFPYIAIISRLSTVIDLKSAYVAERMRHENTGA